MPYSCSRRTFKVFPRWSSCARLGAATIALADRYQYPCPADLGVLRNPVSSKCGQQCGINSCQSDFLLLTSLDTASIGGCSPSSPLRGVGRPKHTHKKIEDKWALCDLVAELQL